MAGNFRYAFLLDENMPHLKRKFPKGRAKTIIDFAKEQGTKDPRVVQIAQDEGRIIVTNNSTDYRREMVIFAKDWGNERCSDLYGLVVLPNDAFSQEKFFPIHRKLEPKLHIQGRGKVTWRDVTRENLLVQADANGRVQVVALPRCPFCLEQEK